MDFNHQKGEIELCMDLLKSPHQRRRVVILRLNVGYLQDRIESSVFFNEVSIEN